MPPVVTKEHTLVKPMVGDLPLVSPGVIDKVHRFDESDVHDLVIEVIHRGLCRVILGRARWVDKDDVSFVLGFGTRHSDKSV